MDIYHHLEPMEEAVMVACRTWGMIIGILGIASSHIDLKIQRARKR